MKTSQGSLNSFLIFVIFCFTFLGFYAILLLAINSGLSGFTRQVSIPTRILINASLISLVFVNLKKLSLPKETLLFLLFMSVYLGRVITDYLWREPYYLSTSEVLFYVFSFAIVPFVSISSFRVSRENVTTILNAIFYSGLIFSILSFLLYSRFIGEVSRLASGTIGEDVISPLALSYCATLIIGTISSYLLYNKVNKIKMTIGIFTVGLSVVPFFLGASRGSLIALFIPFLLMIFSSRSFAFIVYSIFGLFLLGFGLVYLDNALDSGLVDRFVGISDAIEEGSSSASRLNIWKTSFGQFLDNPFWGDKLSVDDFGNYAHNIFIEVLQTTGVLGFIPFILLIVSAFRSSYKLIKYKVEYSWISVIFIQCLIQSLFSGAIYTSAWLWTSMALIFSVRSSSKVWL